MNNAFSSDYAHSFLQLGFEMFGQMHFRQGTGETLGSDSCLKTDILFLFSLPSNLSKLHLKSLLSVGYQCPYSVLLIFVLSRQLPRNHPCICGSQSSGKCQPKVILESLEHAWLPFFQWTWVQTWKHVQTLGYFQVDSFASFWAVFCFL